MTATNGIAQVNTLATHTALTAWSAASAFLIVLVLLGVLFLFAWYVGRGPFVALLLAFYAAYALYGAFPYTSLLPTAPPLTALFAHIGLYAGLVFAFYIILRRVVVSDFLYIGIFGLIALSFFGRRFPSCARVPYLSGRIDLSLHSRDRHPFRAGQILLLVVCRSRNRPLLPRALAMV
jgi:hypothetical protein